MASKHSRDVEERTPRKRSKTDDEFLLYTVSFEKTSGHPGAIVIAKDKQHAVAQSMMAHKDIQIDEVDIVDICTPSAVIIGRTAITRYKPEGELKPLKAFECIGHHMPTKTFLTLVIAENEEKAKGIMEEKLKLHNLDLFEKHPYKFNEIPLNEARVYP